MQEGETGKAFEAFTDYLEMEERSLRGLVKKYGKSTSYVRQLQRWSSAYGWVEWAEAWDASILAEARAKTERQLVERRASVTDREWTASEALIKRAEEINKLSCP